MKRTAFDPVLLDLAEDDDYYVLTEALALFAAEQDAIAADKEYRAVQDGSGAGAEPHRRHAARARTLVTSIQEQMDRNAAVRTQVGGDC